MSWLTSRLCICILIAIIFSLNPLFAQRIDRNVYACSGAFAANGQLQINYSIGESVIFTGTSAGIIATQGFEQPEQDIVTTIHANLSIKNARAFPNPVKELLTLSLDKVLVTSDLEVETVNLYGKKIAVVHPYLASSAEPICTLDFSTYSEGIYFIKISSNARKYNAVLKIIKIR